MPRSGPWRAGRSRRKARAAQAKLIADGLCYVEPVPFLAILDELRTIEVGKDEIVMNFDNTGDHVDRIIHMTAKHPADVQPSHQGHSIGRWEGDTLVIDTIALHSPTRPASVQTCRRARASTWSSG